MKSDISIYDSILNISPTHPSSRDHRSEDLFCPLIEKSKKCHFFQQSVYVIVTHVTLSMQELVIWICCLIYNKDLITLRWSYWFFSQLDYVKFHNIWLIRVLLYNQMCNKVFRRCYFLLEKNPNFHIYQSLLNYKCIFGVVLHQTMHFLNFMATAFLSV